MEKNPMERQPDSRSEKERKEREACLSVCESAKRLFEEAGEEAKREGDFSPAEKGSTKKYPVKSVPDYIVAVSQRERSRAEDMLESLREKDNYYEEKVAAKLKVFLRKEESFLRSLAELEAHFPEMASLIRAQKPYLQEKIAGAENEWKK